MDADYGRIERSVCMRCRMAFRVVDRIPKNFDGEEFECGRCPETGCGRTYWHSTNNSPGQGIARCYVLHA